MEIKYNHKEEKAIGLRKELEKEQEKLKFVKEKTQRALMHVPEGNLRVGKSQGCVQYYHCLPEGGHNGRYLPKSEFELARQLAQKTYDEKAYKLANRRLSQIERILKDYEDDEMEKCFLREHPERQKLILPVESTYQQELEEWLAKPYLGKEFKEDATVILTNNGLRVRSKSEKILADYFDSLEIPYKYECPIYLKPYGTVFPDFTFLSRRTRQEIYWEHEGLLDNPEYARTAVKKLELYEKNGIYPGERLLLTFETSTSVISTELIKEMVERYLI